MHHAPISGMDEALVLQVEILSVPAFGIEARATASRVHAGVVTGKLIEVHSCTSFLRRILRGRAACRDRSGGERGRETTRLGHVAGAMNQSHELPETGCRRGGTAIASRRPSGRSKGCGMTFSERVWLLPLMAIALASCLTQAEVQFVEDCPDPDDCGPGYHLAAAATSGDAVAFNVIVTDPVVTRGRLMELGTDYARAACRREGGDRFLHRRCRAGAQCHRVGDVPRRSGNPATATLGGEPLVGDARLRGRLRHGVIDADIRPRLALTEISSSVASILSVG